LRLSGAGRTLDRLSGLAVRLPWWGGLLSALAAYALLHPVAMLQMPAPMGMVDLAAAALGQLFVFLAQIGQYLLPLVFLVSAMRSGFDRWKRDDLRNSVALDTSASILRGLSWQDFELLVSDALRREGFEKVAVGTGASNGGKGLELTRNGRCYLVDCTDWRSWRAGATAVRKLHERMAMTGAHGGLAVTSGQFTPEAKHFAADKNIELVDGRHLKDLICSKPQAAQAGRHFAVDGLRSLVAAWRNLIAPGRRSVSPQSHHTAPRIGRDQDPQRESGARAVRRRTAAPHLLTEDEEKAAAEQLTALIREERQIGNEIGFSAPTVQVRDTPVSGGQQRRPRIRIRRVAEILGMLLAIVVMWSACGWFLQLPDAPADGPWSLLGAGRESDRMARLTEGVGQSASGGQVPDGQRPLGQFQFGPPGRISDLPSRIRNQGSYGSLRELEAAFDAKYVPPPECYAWESNYQMVKCGNHRIRTRRAFIASGGEETPMLLGNWEDPSENWRPYEQWVRQQGGEPAQEWQPYAPEGPEPQWRRGGEQDVPHSTDREYALEPDGDWRSEDARDSGLHPRKEELAQPYPEQQSTPDWRREFARDWSQEQIEQPQLSPHQDWRQDWIAAPEQAPERDRRRDLGQRPEHETDGDPAHDWRQDWLRVPQQQAEGDWRRSWEAGPGPVEDRHWVDDI
jgi:restriction system protein